MEGALRNFPKSKIQLKSGNLDRLFKPNHFPRWAEKERYENYKNFKFNLFFDNWYFGAAKRDVTLKEKLRLIEIVANTKIEGSVSQLDEGKETIQRQPTTNGNYHL